MPDEIGTSFAYPWTKCSKFQHNIQHEIVQTHYLLRVVHILPMANNLYNSPRFPK